jgi:uncharacterized protein (TIGR02284 family)
MASSSAAQGTASGVTPSASDLDDVREVLEDLLENTRDGEYGFRTCAEEVDAPDLKQVFTEHAAECARSASELIQLIRQCGGTVDDTSGSVSGALHRGWVHVKGAVGANSALSILEECERGEDAAVARYRKAMKANLPPDVRTVIERQAQGAQRNHDQIKALRDQMRVRG